MLLPLLALYSLSGSGIDADVTATFDVSTGLAEVRS